MTDELTSKSETHTGRRHVWAGLLPYIGVILFTIHVGVMLLTATPQSWSTETVILYGVIYMIGWAGIGAGISHIFFGRRISASIGFGANPYEREVGFADLGFGVVGVLAGSYEPSFWIAIIFANAIFRIGCGVGHIMELVRHKNLAVNNTAILLIDFGVPAFLLIGSFFAFPGLFMSWAGSTSF
jgi:hypothetical protein